MGWPQCRSVLRAHCGRRPGGRRPTVIQQLARARRGTGTTDATGLTHRGVAFFPAIFTGGDVAAYKSNPSLLVYCPNATDKTLLHDGALLGENLRDGVCMNDLYIIHLKSVPDADVGQVPAGWTQVFHETVAGTGYTTLYMLTPH